MVTHPEVFLRPESRLVVAVLPRHEQILQAAARENHEVDSVWRHLQNPNKLLDEESPGREVKGPITRAVSIFSTMSAAKRAGQFNIVLGKRLIHSD